MSNQFTRRFFLGAATAASAMRVWGANDRVNVAVVGIGGRGRGHVRQYLAIPGARIAGLCDVNQAARERAQAMLSSDGAEKATEFENMRDAFASSDIDAVSVATPNHWHALSAIWAMEAGKDVYLEKPASHNIHEGLRMVEAARETSRMLQVGSQHRSWPFKIGAIAALQGGLIGDIYKTKGLCYKRRRSIGKRADEPTPAGLNWDLFLGPAPLRPYNELRFAYNWHWFWDTGNGDIGNQGVHELGIARWAMGDPAWPKTAYAHGGKFVYDDDQETPNTLTAHFDFGGREHIFEVRGLMTGAEGAVPTETDPTTSAPLKVMIGDLFYGTEGWAAMTNTGFQAFRGDSNELVMEARPATGDANDATRLHMQNFLDACRSRRHQDLTDEIENAQMSAAMCHLANISYRVGRQLTLDSGPEFVNDAEANKMRTRDYREPYVV